MKKIVVVDCVFLSRRANRLLFLCIVSWRLIKQLIHELLFFYFCRNGIVSLRHTDEHRKCAISDPDASGSDN